MENISFHYEINKTKIFWRRELVGGQRIVVFYYLSHVFSLFMISYFLSWVGIKKIELSAVKHESQSRVH